MVAEIGILVRNEDVISADIDSEMEHEENSEDEEEKTTGNMAFVLPGGRELIPSTTRIIYMDASWKSPAIDFLTPPPELS